MIWLKLDSRLFLYRYYEIDFVAISYKGISWWHTYKVLESWYYDQCTHSPPSYQSLRLLSLGSHSCSTNSHKDTSHAQTWGVAHETINQEMSFLSEIKQFDGKSLKAVDTNLTTADGKKVRIQSIGIYFMPQFNACIWGTFFHVNLGSTLFRHDHEWHTMALEEAPLTIIIMPSTFFENNLI